MTVRACSASPPVEVDRAGLGIEPGDVAGDDHLGAEPLGLLQSAAGQLVAGDAVREAEVVLDPR